MRSGPSHSVPKSDDPKSKALRKLTQQRDDLYDEARDNPDSDADEMVRALLLSGIVSTQPESEEDELVRRSLDEERRRQQIAGRHAAENTGAAVLHGPEAASLAETKINEVQAKMAEVARLAGEAAARPTMDATAVYSRIAEIIGLQSPAGGAREPQGGTGRGEPSH